MGLSFFIISSILFVTGTQNAVDSFWSGRLASWVIFTIVPLLDLLLSGKLKVSLRIPSRIIYFAFNTFIATISYVLFTQWDSILVTQFGSPEENGIYKSIILMASLPLALRVVLETKLLPDFSSHYENNNTQQIRNEFETITKMLLMASILLAGLSVIFAEPVLSLLFNEEIGSNSTILFPVGLLATLVYITAVPGLSLLQAVSKEQIVRNISISQSIFFIISSIFLFESFGVVILPILLLISNLLFLFVILYYSQRIFKIN